MSYYLFNAKLWNRKVKRTQPAKGTFVVKGVKKHFPFSEAIEGVIIESCNDRRKVGEQGLFDVDYFHQVFKKNNFRLKSNSMPKPFPAEALVTSFGPYDLVAPLYLLTHAHKNAILYKKVARFMHKLWKYSIVRLTRNASHQALLRRAYVKNALRDTKFPEDIRRELQNVANKIEERELQRGLGITSEQARGLIDRMF